MTIERYGWWRVMKASLLLYFAKHCLTLTKKWISEMNENKKSHVSINNCSTDSLVTNSKIRKLPMI